MDVSCMPQRRRRFLLDRGSSAIFADDTYADILKAGKVPQDEVDANLDQILRGDYKLKPLHAWHQGRCNAYCSITPDLLPFRAHEHGGMHTLHTKPAGVILWQEPDLGVPQAAASQLREQEAVITSGTINSSITYHFLSGVCAHPEVTELGQPAEDSHVLLVEIFHKQVQVGEVGKT